MTISLTNGGKALSTSETQVIVALADSLIGHYPVPLSAFLDTCVLYPAYPCDILLR